MFDKSLYFKATLEAMNTIFSMGYLLTFGYLFNDKIPLRYNLPHTKTMIEIQIKLFPWWEILNG
jgi:hypothetical protein